MGTNPLLADSDSDGINDAEDAAPADGSKAVAFGSLADGDLAPLGARDGVLAISDALIAMRMMSNDSLASGQDVAHGDVGPSGIWTGRSPLSTRC